MRPSIRPALLALTLSLAAVTAHAATPRPSKVPDGVSPVKYAQVRMLAEEPMRERREQREFFERAKELRKLARRMHAAGKTTLSARGERSCPDVMDEDARVAAKLGVQLRRPASPSAARAVNALGANHRCNDPSADIYTNEGQCETSIVRWNNDLIAAWNDGKGFDDGTNQVQGWATSTDGGVTWVDRGIFPSPSAYPSWVWTSDPVLAVNPTTGAFYFTALGAPSSTQSAIGVIKGRFTGTTFAWGAPTVTRVVNTSTDFLDKQWVAVDPADGRVYLSYTNFPALGSQIDFQWADSALTAWSTYQRISPAAEDGWVQGSRPAVGPAGTVYVVYYRIGPVDADYFRITRSVNRGVSFAAPNDAVSFYANWATGAPGFNRAQGVQFPSIAVDRSGHSHNGRVYLAWNECLNWYDDWNTIGSGTARAEVEPNDAAATATSFTPGQVLHGALATSLDYDYYAVNLTAGQSIIASADSLATGLTATLRLFANDGLTRLTYLAIAQSSLVYGAPTWLFTAPATATYYLRVASSSGAGAYRVVTGTAARTTERGRDQRDAFTAYSDDGGLTFSTPVRVNNDAAGYDDWLPEISVAPTGQAVCAWYDWRDSAPATSGGESSIYLATSATGGASWQEQGAVTDVRTNWTNVATNILPNQGDYFSLLSDSQGYAVAWSDGRDLNPNVYMAAIAPVTTGVAPEAAPALRLVVNGPATGSAHVAFDLPAAGRARLDVFDLLGRHVATLLDGNLGAGTHGADWNLADGTGARVGAGMYWARLESGGRSATARLVVLR